MCRLFIAVGTASGYSSVASHSSQRQQIQARGSTTRTERMAKSNASETTGVSSAGRYLSCRHIERGLAFWGSSVTACCGNTATGRRPRIAPFAGDITKEAIVEGRERIIARHKVRDIVPECEGCAHLQENDWAYHMSPYLVDEVTAAHFTTCDIRCNYCYTRQH